MRIFKFGGASVKDAEGVKNLFSIVRNHLDEPLFVVVSAMGKTTNLLERLSRDSFHNKRTERVLFDQLRTEHLAIASELFDGDRVWSEALLPVFEQLDKALTSHLDQPYAFFYDQTVSFGEILSTRLIHAYLKQEGLDVKWVPAAQLVRTNNRHRQAEVEWEITCKNVQNETAKAGQILITQGFIGSTSEGFITTLGREGSDYTAAILAYAFDAKELTIWKDVPGMMNADPRFFPDAKKLENISFREAIELSYYGAKVIHPKTLQPLKKKNIPLFVKSFVEPHEKGSVINSDPNFDRSLPSFIIKPDQVLLSISPLDFSFIIEENLSHIFSEFVRFDIKVNLMQNSAINFSVCVNDSPENLRRLIQELRKDYHVKFNRGLRLLTIRHHTPDIQERLLKHQEVLLEQKTRDTSRFIIRELKNDLK